MGANKGGEFLINFDAPEAFTPEAFTDEHKMISVMTEQFVEEEVLPQQDRMESHDWTATTDLLKRCGELGLLGIEVPQEFGGEGLDKVSAMIVAEKLARVASFGVSYGGHSGIGTLPIVYFGSDDLKKKYLPDLCKGARISAYALSEAGSGSDALAAKTTAMLSPDKSHWIANGEKMWITNAAFANLFITFAQANGNAFTCFAVEKDFTGVSTGAEEHKMGLKGSSTRTLVLDNARIPLRNVIGEIGKGHRVAFNILNIGRAKIGAGAVGASKTALNDAIQYAKQRIAFGRPIASFGAVRQKIAEMAIRIWVAESMVYRTAGLMDDALASIEASDSVQTLKAVEEYAAECSMVKVYCSEALDYVVDEAVQIYGGYGYSADYPVERYYRDARVNRIFEGTNEINRLLIPGILFKRASTGQLSLGKAIEHAANEVMSHSNPVTRAPGIPPEAAATAAKKATLFVLGEAQKKFGDGLRDEQEVLMQLSDMMMNTYAIDTALARVQRSANDLGALAFQTFANDALSRIETSAKQTLAAVADGENLRMQLAGVNHLLNWIPINTIHTRQRIAEHLIDYGKYAL